MLDDVPINTITELCNEIYNTEYWPKYTKESLFISIKKTEKTIRCQEYMTSHKATIENYNGSHEKGDRRRT